MNFSKYILALLGFGSDVITVTSGTAGNAGSTAAELIDILVNFKFGHMLENTKAIRTDKVKIEWMIRTISRKDLGIVHG